MEGIYALGEGTEGFFKCVSLYHKGYTCIVSSHKAVLSMRMKYNYTSRGISFDEERNVDTR